MSLSSIVIGGSILVGWIFVTFTSLGVSRYLKHKEEPCEEEPEIYHPIGPIYRQRKEQKG